MTNQLEITNINKGRDNESKHALANDPNYQILITRINSNIVNSTIKSEKVSLDKIELSDVDMFGPKFGFGKFCLKTTPFIPGIVFHRSPSVVCLFIINCDDKQYVLLTVQPRIPSGYSAFPELIAGMTDSNTGEFKLVMKDEILEETGLTIDTSKLVNLGEADAFLKNKLDNIICKSDKSNKNTYQWLFTSDKLKNHQGWFNSAGGCSETSNFYLYETEMNLIQFNNLLRKIESESYGDGDENIKLIVVPLDKLLEVSPSITSGHSIALYNRYLQKKVILPNSFGEFSYILLYILYILYMLCALIVTISLLIHLIKS